MATDSENPYKKQRKWLRFSKPRDQFLLMLPSFCLLVFGIILSYIFISNVRNEAVFILMDNNIESEIVTGFLNKTNYFLKAFWGIAGALGLVGFIWAFRISHWIFGPFARIERNLNSILDGTFEPEKLKVRDEDALFPMIELFRKILLKNK